MRWCSFAYNPGLVSTPSNTEIEWTYKRKAAVSAGTDFWLVEVDEDPGMSQWSTTTITLDSPLVDPANGLLVDELNGCFRRRL